MVKVGVIFVFFFSSRRRHTRLTCDWSSDVCSSDLGGELVRAEVQTGDVGASHRDLDAELARAAAELQRAEPRDVAQRLDLIFGDVADTPREHVPSVEVQSVA